MMAAQAGEHVVWLIWLLDFIIGEEQRMAGHAWWDSWRRRALLLFRCCSGGAIRSSAFTWAARHEAVPRGAVRAGGHISDECGR